MTSSDQSLKATGLERRLPLLVDEEEEAEAASGISHTSSGEATDETELIFVRRTETGSAEPRKAPGEGRVTLSSPPNPKLEELWKKAEGVMAARQSRVREVMEEFGVADVAPVSDELEEELWQVVEEEGEWTLQEAADLV